MPPDPEQTYVLALGSNRGSTRGRTPAAMLCAALAELERAQISILAIAPIVATAPIGPAQRRFANTAVVARCSLLPPQLIILLKSIERHLGRRPAQRWGNRCIDIDIILWSGGLWQDRALSIPHPAWRGRRFVVDPVAQIVPDWRDPVTGHSARQIKARFGR
jgi:2-amino-4-hydroxy-6-hydroxymethyldihydropteridine diphosphokinase